MKDYIRGKLFDDNDPFVERFISSLGSTDINPARDIASNSTKNQYRELAEAFSEFKPSFWEQLGSGALSGVFKGIGALLAEKMAADREKEMLQMQIDAKKLHPAAQSALVGIAGRQRAPYQGQNVSMGAPSRGAQLGQGINELQMRLAKIRGY